MKLTKLQPELFKKKERERERPQINKIRNEKGEVTNHHRTAKITRDY